MFHLSLSKQRDKTIIWRGRINHWASKAKAVGPQKCQWF